MDNIAYMGKATLNLFKTTWGSFGQYEMTTILLPKGDELVRLDVERTTPNRWVGKVRKTLEIAGYKLEGVFINNDSNKNIRREIYIEKIEPMPEFIVIENSYRTSRRHKVTYTIYEPKTGETKDASIVELERVETKIVENDKRIKKISRTITGQHIEYGGRYYKLSETYNDKVVEEKLKRLDIVIGDTPTGLYVTGDTYPIKEYLKDLGLRWDRYTKTWVPKREGTITADKLEKELKSISEKIGIKIEVDRIEMLQSNKLKSKRADSLSA